MPSGRVRVDHGDGGDDHNVLSSAQRGKEERERNKAP